MNRTRMARCFFTILGLTFLAFFYHTDNVYGWCQETQCEWVSGGEAVACTVCSTLPDGSEDCVETTCGGGNVLACNGVPDNCSGGGGGGNGGSACVAPQRVNCPTNSDCFPQEGLLCNTTNIDYNSSGTVGPDGAGGNTGCVLGNAQQGDYACNPWFCGYNITTYACCAAGSVSMYHYVSGAQYARSGDFHPDSGPGEGSINCYPGWEVPGHFYQGGCTYNDNGRLRYCTYYTLCQGEDQKINECKQLCTAGTATSLVLPTNGAVYSGPSGTASVEFDWEAPSSWGSQESGTNRSYTLCVGSNSSDPCSGGSSYTVGTGTNPVSTSTQNVAFGTKYWGVKANNMCGMSSPLSAVRNICIEGYTLPGDAGVGNAYFSQWGACNVNTHKRTRTCREDCGTDNCTAAAAAGLLEEDCEGEIRGTLFDATNLSSCPSFDPNTGYLIGVDTTLTPNNRAFDMADQSNVPTHPWATITSPQTDSGGNYNVRVYAPATYSYDFNDLRDMYIVSTGPKLTCTSGVAVVPGNSTNCGTQPCSIVNNMSFGFERYWGGWWQVQGASVHGETGLRSSIPTGLVSEQSLILPEPSMGNRRGVASYGVASDTMLGVNTNAKVSTSLWKALSNYDGVIYDYGYFNQQFKKNFTTAWDGVSAISYDDGGRGYQIFKVTGSVSNFNYSPTGTEKVIFLISGDVTINNNITVPSGAFMAVLAGGTINIGTSVTNVDGWYLADTITVRCIDANNDSDCDRTDTQFVGNGSFVGWESIILSRDRGGDTNILGPSEKFNYRMDLYNNAPDPMKIFTKKYKPYVP